MGFSNSYQQFFATGDSANYLAANPKARSFATTLLATENPEILRAVLKEQFPPDMLDTNAPPATNSAAFNPSQLNGMSKEQWKTLIQSAILNPNARQALQELQQGKQGK